MMRSLNVDVDVDVGMIGLGALVEPDHPPLDSVQAETMAQYLARLLAVCIEVH